MTCCESHDRPRQRLMRVFREQSLGGLQHAAEGRMAVERSGFSILYVTVCSVSCDMLVMLLDTLPTPLEEGQLEQGAESNESD